MNARGHRAGKEVRDAAEARKFTVRGPRDVPGSTPRDTNDCFLARGAKRALKVRNAWFGIGVVDLEVDEGVIERYQLRPIDGRRIEVFDREKLDQEALARTLDGLEIELLPPPPGKRLGDRAGKQSGSNRREGQAPSVHRAQPLRSLLFDEPR